MLELGVFCGKDLTDCRDEFPANWFARAKLSPSGRDCSLNYFGVDASQPLSVWRRKGSDSSDGPLVASPLSGIAAITSDGACRTRDARPRSAAGRRCGGMSLKSGSIADRAIPCAGRANGRRSCIGPMTAGKSRRHPRSCVTGFIPAVCLAQYGSGGHLFNSARRMISWLQGVRNLAAD